MGQTNHPDHRSAQYLQEANWARDATIPDIRIRMSQWKDKTAEYQALEAELQRRSMRPVWWTLWAAVIAAALGGATLLVQLLG